MIAFHYPPLRGVSGIQRTLKFSRYLPEYGWQPLILTASSKAYTQVGAQVGEELLGEIPAYVPVQRAFALDTARHLAFRGAYLSWMALPDRWVSWWLGGVLGGLRLVRTYRPAILWSTYPIATAHLIGLTLHKLTGIPWVADFRDSMTEDHYPSEPMTWRVYRWIERLTVRHCTQAVFTTPGTLRMYAERYPDIPQNRWAIIANGYDEENFLDAEQAIIGRDTLHERLVLVHSGLLYPLERDPRTFFAAVSDLRHAGAISPATVQIILRASGHEDYYRQYLHECGIDDIVRLEAFIPYQQALTEMLHADGLLVFQAANCNHQIPAKIYEYLRARRPIFALTDPQGDTARVLQEAGIDTLVALDSRQAITQGLLHFLAQVRAGRAPIASDHIIARHSRKSRTRELAELLTQTG
jgi:glycosyltransferase involved in cell wall biosynthesis